MQIEMYAIFNKCKYSEDDCHKNKIIPEKLRVFSYNGHYRGKFTFKYILIIYS